MHVSIGDFLVAEVPERIGRDGDAVAFAAPTAPPIRLAHRLTPSSRPSSPSPPTQLYAENLDAGNSSCCAPSGSQFLLVCPALTRQRDEGKPRIKHRSHTDRGTEAPILRFIRDPSVFHLWLKKMCIAKRCYRGANAHGSPVYRLALAQAITATSTPTPAPLPVRTPRCRPLVRRSARRSGSPARRRCRSTD